MAEFNCIRDPQFQNIKKKFICISTGYSGKIEARQGGMGQNCNIISKEELSTLYDLIIKLN